MIAAVVFGASAQHKGEGKVYGPEKGAFSTEISFNPFNSSNQNFSLAALKGRYFMTGKDALVLELGFNYHGEKQTDADNSDVYQKSHNGRFNLELGYERHFYQYKRVDLYAGAELGFVCYTAGATTTTEVGNKVIETVYKNYAGGVLNNNNVASTGFNVGLFTGINFYVYKGLYVGAQFGLGYEGTFGCDKELTVDGTKTKLSNPKSSVNDFGLQVQPTFSLGWTF